MTAAEGEDLAGWIAATGKNLTTIFVTHGHGDHFFGAAPVLDRFPEATMVATPAVVEGMKKQLSPAWLDGFWRARFPGQLPDRLFVAEPLDGHTFRLEDQDLVAVDLGHTDTDGSAALHVPSIGLVVAGDAVYSDVHLYLVESPAQGSRRGWRRSTWSRHCGRRPSSPAIGRPTPPRSALHRRDPPLPARLRSRGQADDHRTRLYNAVIVEYPDRLNRGVLWNSTKAVKA